MSAFKSLSVALACIFLGGVFGTSSAVLAAPGDEPAVLVSQSLPSWNSGAVAVSPDGRFAAVASHINFSEAPLTIWDLWANRVVKQIDKTDCGLQAGFSASGRTLITGGGSMAIIDTKDWTERTRLPGWTFLDVFPNADLVLAAKGMEWAVIDTDTAKVVYKAVMPDYMFVGAVSPDGKRIAISGVQGNVSLYSWPDKVLTGTAEATVPRGIKTTRQLLFADENNVLCIIDEGNRQNSIRKFDFKGVAVGDLSAGQPLSVGTAMRMADGSIITFSDLGSRYSGAYMWKNGIAKRLPFLGNSYYAAAATGDKLVYSTNRQDRVHYVDVSTGEDIASLFIPFKVKKLVLWPDGNSVTSVHENAAASEVVVWDADKMKVRSKSELPYRGSVVSSSGKRVASWGAGIQVTDLESGRVIFEQKGLVAGCGFSADGSQLFTIEKTSQPLVSQIDLGSGERRDLGKLDHIPKSFQTYVFSPDGRLVAGATEQKTSVFDSASGQLLWSADSEYCADRISYFFMPDSKSFWFVNKEQRVRICEARSGNLVQEFKTKGHVYIDLSVDPEAKTVWAAGVGLWAKYDLTNGNVTVTPHPDEVAAIAGRGEKVFLGERAVEYWNGTQKLSRTTLLPQKDRLKNSSEWLTTFSDGRNEASPKAVQTEFAKWVPNSQLGVGSQVPTGVAKVPSVVAPVPVETKQVPVPEKPVSPPPVPQKIVLPIPKAVLLVRFTTTTPAEEKLAAEFAVALREKVGAAFKAEAELPEPLLTMDAQGRANTATQYEADTVLGGSLQANGQRVAITARLYDGKSGRLIRESGISENGKTAIADLATSLARKFWSAELE